jgi:hypothetical protein
VTAGPCAAESSARRHPGLRRREFQYLLPHRVRHGTAVLRPRHDWRSARTVQLDPLVSRSYHHWHAFVPGVSAGDPYEYRVYGPFDPVSDRRFDPNKLLLDPYGRAVAVPRQYGRAAANPPGEGRRRSAEAALLAGRSFTRCMCAGLPLTRTPASAKESVARFSAQRSLDLSGVKPRDLMQDAQCCLIMICCCCREVVRVNTQVRGSNSVVECQLPKLDVVGSSPISRSISTT